MCLKSFFNSILVPIAVLFVLVNTLNTEVYGSDLFNQVERTKSTMFYEYFRKTVDSLYESDEIEENGEIKETDKIKKLASYYIKNKDSLSNQVQYKYDKLIVKDVKTRNQNIVAERNSRSNKYSMLGRLSIPDISVDVAVFDTNAQGCVDAKDSAAYFKMGDTYVVADHWYDGFERIRDCKKGTSAFIDTGEKRVEYVCTQVILGHNTGSDLTDNNYNSVVRKWNPNGITLYTCVNGWRNVRIAFFEPKWCDEIIDKINPSGYTYNKE